ncbi:MAG: NuoI/complex I 23 kDa subunit family protein [Ignavibacteria bacterium]
MKYFKHIYQAISTILIGMGITFRHLFQKSVTIQYPEVRLQLPERERNRIFVNIDDCIGCDQCARACPVSCITIETIKAVPGDIVGKTGVTSQGKKKSLFVSKFEIDFGKCCFCQLCVFPCPTECIYMTDVFEYSTYSRDGLIYQFSDMTPEMVEEKKKKLEEYNIEQAKKKEAAAAKPTAKPVNIQPPEAKSSEDENKAQ